MKCKICSHEAADECLCPLHKRAHEEIVKKFKVWEGALNISWSQYLQEIQKNSLTGEWAKEVAKHLIEEEHKRCQAK